MRDKLIEDLKGFRTPICEGLNAKLPYAEELADYLLENGVIKKLIEQYKKLLNELKGAPLNNSEYEILYKDLLSKYKMLTEENKAWQAQLISQEEKADKSYYDLACEVENLRAENERLKAPRYIIKSDKKACDFDFNTDIIAFPNDYKIEMLPTVETVRADTVRKMQERLHEQFRGSVAYTRSYIHDGIDQIAKEMLEDT